MFTKGPWKAEYVDHVTDGNNFTLSTVDVDVDPDGRPHDYGHSILEGGLVLESDTENRANARLLETAPDLYEALKALLEHVPDEPNPNWDEAFVADVATARAALAKADGTEQLLDAASDNDMAKASEEADLLRDPTRWGLEGDG